MPEAEGSSAGINVAPPFDMPSKEVNRRANRSGENDKQRPDDLVTAFGFCGHNCDEHPQPEGEKGNADDQNRNRCVELPIFQPLHFLVKFFQGFVEFVQAVLKCTRALWQTSISE